MFDFSLWKSLHFPGSNLCESLEHCFYCIHCVMPKGVKLGGFKTWYEFYYACETLLQSWNTGSSSDFFITKLILLLTPFICVHTKRKVNWRLKTQVIKMEVMNWRTSKNLLKMRTWILKNCRLQKRRDTMTWSQRRQQKMWRRILKVRYLAIFYMNYYQQNVHFS